MVILNTGGTEIRDAVADLIATGQYGTDGTTEATTDTGLGSAVAATDLAVTIRKSGLTIEANHELDSVTGNGNTLREFELASASGSLTRTTTTDLEKDINKEVYTTVVIFGSIN